jgi:hypothetical protein
VIRLTSNVLLPVLAALVCSIAATAADLDPTVPTAAFGSDYFSTGSGSHFNFGGGIGDVNFIGLPIGPFKTDTIIQRRADATLGGPAAIPIQIVALSLKSAAPVNVGGSFFDVFITLDPANLANDTGTMSITGNTTSGGVFSSSLNIFFQAHFQPVSTGFAFDVFSQANVSNGSTPWTPIPGSAIVLVNGLDDGTVSDQQANKHSGLICSAPTGACEVDFFAPNVTRVTNTGNFSLVETAAVPEPATLWTLLSGLLMMCRRQRANVS